MSLTVQACLRAGIARLSVGTGEGMPDPARDVRLLLAHAIGLPADRLALHLQDPVSPEAQARFDAALTARAAHQPVSQIIGHRQFWGREFIVTRDTLDPRPETETLIAAALEWPFTRVLDLGTGTGAILLSLLAERPAATGLGTDLSAAALAVAQANAARLGLSDRAAFQVSDWFSDVTGTFDLIVSNPPYIAADEMAGLARDVLDWEPHLALTPGGDGLGPYRTIATHARRFLRPKAPILLEIGPTQGPAVAALLTGAGFDRVRILDDLDGRNRVVAAQNR
jgi:release factor glutamine methyltransferase